MLVLVNNAGITADGLAIQLEDEQWDNGHRHQPDRRLPHDAPGDARR